MEHIHRMATLYASQLLHQFGYTREEVAAALNVRLENIDHHIDPTDSNSSSHSSEATGDELLARCHEATLARMTLNERFYELVQVCHADGHTIEDIARAGNAHPGTIEHAIAFPPRSLGDLNDAYFVALRDGHTPPQDRRGTPRRRATLRERPGPAMMTAITDTPWTTARAGRGSERP